MGVFANRDVPKGGILSCLYFFQKQGHAARGIGVS